MSVRRVAITGLGILAPSGNSVEELLTNMAEGKSAIRKLPSELACRLRSPVGAPVNFDDGAYFDVPRLRSLDRVSQLALVAANRAIADAQLDFAKERQDRCGVFVGSSLGGARTTDAGYFELYAQSSQRVNPYTVIGAMTNAAASWIAIEHELTGPNLTFCTACSSSAVALGEAARRIRLGEADIMLAGGTEAPLTFGVLRAWEALRALASEDSIDPAASCRPFSLDRDGLVIGEGAAFLVLEEWQRATRRGAVIHAELSGYGLSFDAGHIARPSVHGQASAMRAALESASLSPAAIGYINAHGSATIQNDATETAAIKDVFGELARAIPVSSTKSMHGHLLGAAGALEFAIAVISLESGLLPPTMHLRVADPACDLDYVPGRARTGVELRAVMSNSFAFGGTNAVLVAEAANRCNDGLIN